MACEREERSANVEMSFDVCKEHMESNPLSVALHADGVDPMVVAESLMSLIEETATYRLAEYPPLRLLITSEWDGEVLPERAQKHIVSLAAREYMVHMIRDRSYHTGQQAAIMELPID